MYIVRKFHQQIDSFVCSGSRRAFLISFTLLVVVLGTLGALAFKFGAPAQNGRPWDSPVILDGAWRVINGQVPDRDFYNYTGLLPLYMARLGMKITHPCASAIDYGNVIFMAALVLPAMAVLRRRTGAFTAFLFCLFIGLLVVTPRPLGDPYDYVDHAMLYNRYGEACVALLGVLLFLPPRPGFGGPRLNWLEAILGGLLLTALVGCKANYFAVGIGFFGLSFVMGRLGLGRAAVCLVAAGIFFAIALAISGIPFSDMLTDFRLMSASQVVNDRLHTLSVHVVKSIWLLPLLLLLVWENYLGRAERAEQPPLPWRDTLLMVSLFGCAGFLIATNSQVGEMPLLALAALYGAELILRQPGSSADTPFFVVARHVGAVALLLFFLLPHIGLDLETLRYATYAAKDKRWEVPAELQSTNLRDFRFVLFGTRPEEMRKYMNDLDEGIQLLRRHPDPQMRLDALLFSNPFHIALGLKPALGGLICLAPPGINKKSHPPLARMLGNATHILAPRGCATLKEIYGAEWDALNLKIVEETKNYTLLKIPDQESSKRGQP